MNDKLRVVCISQARMSSTRLPGKVLMPLCGKPLLHYHISRLLRAQRLDQLVVATTHEPADDPIERFCAASGIACYRGATDDVLGRFAGCARRYRAEVVVRVTADCPLIDPILVDRAVDALLTGEDAPDYVNLDYAHYPRGLDVEVFRRATLEEAERLAGTAYEREHVTPYIYNHPERFRRREIQSEDPARYRWCIDEQADFDLVARMLEALLPHNPDFTWRDCIALMRANPDWPAINAHVEQKAAIPPVPEA